MFIALEVMAGKNEGLIVVIAILATSMAISDNGLNEMHIKQSGKFPVNSCKDSIK
jgi:hypothetical protein